MPEHARIAHKTLIEFIAAAYRAAGIPAADAAKATLDAGGSAGPWPGTTGCPR